MLSAHFTEAELVAGEPAGTVVPPAVRERARATADLLERVRAVLGVPLLVTSWYRDPVHNAEVSGVSNSQHLTGAAADVLAVGLLIGDAVDRFLAGQARGAVGPFGQAIFYPGRGHIHLSTRDGTNAVDSVLLAFSNPDGTVRYTKADPATVATLPRLVGLAVPALLALLVVGFLLLMAAARPHR